MSAETAQAKLTRMKEILAKNNLAETVPIRLQLLQAELLVELIDQIEMLRRTLESSDILNEESRHP
jgi:hypothetical protein